MTSPVCRPYVLPERFTIPMVDAQNFGIEMPQGMVSCTSWSQPCAECAACTFIVSCSSAPSKAQ